MTRRKNHAHNGTPPLPVANTSDNRQPVPRKLPDRRPRTPESSTAFSNATNVAAATAPALYAQAQPTGRQGRRRKNKKKKVLDPPPVSTPSNQNGPLTSSQNPSPSPQQRNNSDEVGGGNIDLGLPPHPSRSGSLSVSLTAVDGREHPERASGITPDQAKSTATKKTEGLIPPRFDMLVKMREPQDLSGKVDIPDRDKGMMGGYGVVHVGNLGDRELAVEVAVKMLKATKIKEEKYRPKSIEEIEAEGRNERRLRREINVWAALKHRNICELLGFTADLHDYRVMVSPWYKRGSAANLLNNPDLTLDDRTRLTKEVCEGLHYLHRFKVVHGDMKPTNVLVDNDGVAKLCDFGLVKLNDWEGKHDMTTTSPYAGTTRYKAPELFISNENQWPEATLEGDIYSLGCMMVEFIEGVRPFNRFKPSKDITRAITGRKPPTWRDQACSRRAVLDPARNVLAVREG